MATPPDKRTVTEALLEKGSAFVYLDPRQPGVAVPPWFRTQPQLVLQIGLNMAIPIPDLTVDEEGIVATLSFSRTLHRCVVPWSAVFALVGDDGKGSVFLESVPPEVRREIDRVAAPEPLTREAEGEGDGESPQPDAAADDDSGIATLPARTENVIPMWPRGVSQSPRRSQPPPRRDSEPPKPGGGPQKPRPTHLRRVK